MELVYSKPPYLSEVQCVDSADMLEIATIYNPDFLKKREISLCLFAYLQSVLVCNCLQL